MEGTNINHCQGLFDHSLGNLETIATTQEVILKRCKKCLYEEVLPHSKKAFIFTNDKQIQSDRWAADDTAKEILQPTNGDGSVNEDFTEAFGFNPFDERTKIATPRVQGGLK